MSGTANVSFENNHWSAAAPYSTGQPKKRSNSGRLELRGCAKLTPIWRMFRPHVRADPFNGGESKLGVLAEVMTRETDKVELDDDPVLNWQQFHPHRFIDDPAIASVKRQRLADGSCSGGDIEQQSCFA